MLDKHLRPVKEVALDPMVGALCERIHPMTVTLAGGIIGLAAGGAALLGWYGAGLVLWLLNRLLDGLDGTIARRYQKASDAGGYIDILTDFVVYAWIPVALALASQDAVALAAVAFLLATFYVNSASWMYLSSILEKRNRGAAAQGELTTITMPGGLIEGTETIIAYCAFFLVPQSLTALYVGLGLLVVVTIIQRLIWAIRHL